MSAEEKNEDPSPPSSHFIGKREDLMKVKRVTKFINGRDVLVLYHNGTFHAMDTRCYHSGGPLQNGDIEEFSGKLCIVCPWHKYKITLLEGEGLYQAVDPSQKVLKPKWASKGIKQRVHLVKEVNGDVFVTLNDFPGSLDSDYYQSEQYRAIFNKAENKM
ncbi:Rieske domain-containing protein-like [Brienomyrus brachyistius]|uniref:Rieske domain-containing protein-like n=1 Tax=Brienomyrus brachyistius TaxID=42636 RepID=UPI0020B3A046|nr:Rieske domain-containing protein-like [Brienomyrus brachyistius]